MKKMLFTALVAACAMTACGTKTTETATAEEVAREVGSSDIAYVQVEAVLAQCDLFLNEGAALQEKDPESTEKLGPERAEPAGRSRPAAGKIPERADYHQRCTGPAAEHRKARGFVPELRTERSPGARRRELRVHQPCAGSVAPRCAGDQRRQEIQAHHNATALIDAIRRLTSRPPCLRRSTSSTQRTRKPPRNKGACILHPGRAVPIGGGFFSDGGASTGPRRQRTAPGSGQKRHS